MTLCTVASRHACNVVMIEVILCAASLSLCYTATCYDISGCTGSCWSMGDSKCKAFSTLHIQAEQTQIQWKQPLLVCCFHDVYNIMARRICVSRFWLAGGKAVILIGFPFYPCIVGVNPQPWMPINTQTKECIASIRSARVAPIPPNTPLKSWTEILQKSVQSWYIPFALQVHVCYDIKVRKMSSNRGYLTMRFLHANLMYRILLPVHHLNVSLYANFVHTVHELADDNLYHHKAPWWHCVPLMQLLEQRTKLQCVPPDVKYGQLLWLSTGVSSSKLWLDTRLKALIYSCISWSLLSEAVTTCTLWYFNQRAPHLYDGYFHGSRESILRAWQI